MSGEWPTHCAGADRQPPGLRGVCQGSPGGLAGRHGGNLKTEREGGGRECATVRYIAFSTESVKKLISTVFLKLHQHMHDFLNFLCIHNILRHTLFGSDISNSVFLFLFHVI